MTDTFAPLKIDVVSDVMCPWCYIGKKRLEKALDMRPDLSVEISWRPFQLDGTIPKKGIDRQEYLSKKFGGDERAASVYQQIKEAGDAEDIAFAFDLIEKSPNTLNAHRLIRWATTTGAQNELVERLFQLFFLEGADLTDEQVLIEAAEEIGMDDEVVERLLDGDNDVEEVKKEIAAASQMGVTGVPCFIIDEKFAVMGAQQPETLVQAFDQALASRGEAN